MTDYTITLKFDAALTDNYFFPFLDHYADLPLVQLRANYCSVAIANSYILIIHWQGWVYDSHKPVYDMTVS